MIIDVYNLLIEQPGFNKVLGNDYVFLEYNCPIDIDRFKLFSKANILTYVVSGKKDWIAPDKKVHITGGDAIFVRKGVYTTNQYFEDTYCTLLFFLHDDFLERFVRDHDLPETPSTPGEFTSIYEIQTNELFNTLVQSVFQYMIMPEIPQDLVELKVKELLFNILLNPGNRDLLRFIKSQSQSGSSELTDIMLQNFKYNLKLEEFAKMNGRSLSSFKRDFKAEFGTSPMQWLNEKRLDYSSTLLKGTELTVNEVCYESGFNSPSHFIRSFKQQFGLPPQQFRDSQAALN